MSIRTLILPLLMLLLLGCRGNVNESAFKRIKRGMPLQEVEALLGPGKEMTDDEMLEIMKKQAENAPPEVRQNADKMTAQAVQGLTGRKWQEGKRMIAVFLRDDRVQFPYREGF
jgi:hypothetical protein